MKFRVIFPLFDAQEEFKFENCSTNEEFLAEIVNIFFSNSELRVKEASLAVFMAYRDHYPTYLKSLSLEQIELLNFEITKASPKIIKLRRIALSALAKVA